MKKIIYLFVFITICSCSSYQYYVSKGDNLLYKQKDSINSKDSLFSADVSVIRETIEGESGDYTNTYTQYYDRKGYLVAFVSVSRFFNSGCYDGCIEEKTIYSVRNDKLKKESYHLCNDKGENIKDTISCVFNYRFEYKITPYITMKHFTSKTTH